ncbi:hypothetical protein N7463_000813 [Penicillium fimorum]|uniref:MYND-type domain-containing protein n=1 Tax=Penicillium fimorum TaxID=1882269 RepID=A0A9X0CBG5_9EURO|nr:hypothetical protein N7463_000813 [Penicillium fimorum]
MSPPSGCGVCGKKDEVLRCSGCKVMMYCGAEYQTAHRQDHKSACSAIRRCCIAMEKEEQALRAHPDDIFTHGVGRFWGIFDTRHYMRARAAFSNTLSLVGHIESLQAQLDILIEDLRLCRSDNMDSRDVIPGLMNANPLEPANMSYDGMIDLPHMVSVTLVKIKVLQVLFMNMGSPGGITADMLVFGLKSSTIAKNPIIANCDDEWLEIVKLKAQIRALYEAVHKLNPHFWPALVNPGEHLEAKAMIFSIGSVEQMQMALDLTYEAWCETPGAITVIEVAIEGNLR